MPNPLILLDAGDTVIVETPGAAGPMLSWPHIEPVPGAAEALAGLAPRFTLVLASNADESTGEMARQALARLGLDGFFSKCYTSIDLGVRKPDPAFFLAILSACDASRQYAVMVGNSFPIDVAGAKSSGLRAVWYNPGLAIAPGGIPFQDAELADMHSLPDLLSRPTLPDIPTCIGWLAEQGGEEGLFNHVQAVAFAAYHMACALRTAGQPIDPLLAHRGGLLHDLDKITHASHGLAHGEYSAALLEKRGWPALGRIARRHVFNERNLTASLTLEEKTVLYADKLVEGDAFAGLSQRVSRLMGRYPSYADQMQTSLPRLQALEAELCKLADLKPEQFYSDLQASWPASFPAGPGK